MIVLDILKAFLSKEGSVIDLVFSPRNMTHMNDSPRTRPKERGMESMGRSITGTVLSTQKML